MRLRIPVLIFLRVPIILLLVIRRARLPLMVMLIRVLLLAVLALGPVRSLIRLRVHVLLRVLSFLVLSLFVRIITLMRLFPVFVLRVLNLLRRPLMSGLMLSPRAAAMSAVPILLMRLTICVVLRLLMKFKSPSVISQ